MKTFKKIRKSFWNTHPEYKPEYRKTYEQNQYKTEIRTAFVEYINQLYMSGEITENQANKITL